MKLRTTSVQKSNTRQILNINSATFAELIREDAASLFFEFEFRLSLKNSDKNIENYDKVVITVKRKEFSDNNKNSENNSSGLNASKSISFKKNPVNVLGRKEDIEKTTLPESLPHKVNSRLSRGKSSIQAILSREDYVFQSEVLISPLIERFNNNYFSFTEINSPQYKPPRRSASSDRIRIDPSDILTRINEERIDITEPVFGCGEISNLTSEDNLDSEELRFSLTTKKSISTLQYDLAKYFLDVVPRSPNDDNVTWYEKRVVTKQLEDIFVKRDIKIDKINKDLNLVVRFDLHNKDTNLIDESVSVDLNISRHTEAFYAIINPPTVSGIANEKFANLTISDADKRNQALGYNIYVKNIDSQKSVDKYSFLGFVKKVNDSTSLELPVKSDLSVVRVVPLNSLGQESNVFTDFMVGNGHKLFGSLSISPKQIGKNTIRIDVFGIPKISDTSGCKITLYKRNCTKGFNSTFEVFSTKNNAQFNVPISFQDTEVETGIVYEYRAVASTGIALDEIICFSNDAMIRNAAFSDRFNNIRVNLSEANSNIERSDTSQGSATISFKISSTAASSDQSTLDEFFKIYSEDLFNRYLNSSNNTGLATSFQNEVKNYKDIFFHQVVRNNLNTGERVTFDLVPDGIFIDGPETQKSTGVSPLNVQHTYTYEVSTFLRNPLELLKRYVVSGKVDYKIETNQDLGGKTTSKSYFYYPYKWRNFSTKTGKLYADDSKGIAIIDAYDSFTSETIGFTASHRVDSSSKFSSIDAVSTVRVDINTVKVTWNSFGTSSLTGDRLYDSFIVMKVVNGIRSFVGRTFQNFIYHELNETDLGSVYYVVVPIMSEFDIGTPGYSNDILVRPEGLTQRIKSSFLDKPVFESKNAYSPDKIVKNDSLKISLEKPGVVSKILTPKIYKK